MMPKEETCATVCEGCLNRMVNGDNLMERKEAGAAAGDFVCVI